MRTVGLKSGFASASSHWRVKRRYPRSSLLEARDLAPRSSLSHYIHAMQKPCLIPSLDVPGNHSLSMAIGSSARSRDRLDYSRRHLLSYEPMDLVLIDDAKVSY